MVMLEVCVDSVGAIAGAVAGGAGRIELCARLDLDGLSPSAADVESALAIATVPVFVMVRPRAGDFVVGADELGAMLIEIDRLRALRVPGVVFGAIERSGAVDVATTRALVARARPMAVTFHRAFDRAPDPRAALDALIELGVDRVLTSGGAPDAERGIPVLARLVAAAAGRIVVMPGGKVRAHNAARIVRGTGAVEIHSSTPFHVAAVVGPGV